MRKNIIRIELVILLTAFFLQVSGQDGNTGSIYSRYGIGNLHSQALGKSLGMGGVAIAFNSPFEINPINPASYSSYRRQTFLFQVGVRVKRDDISTESNSFTSYAGSLASINLACKLTKFWALSIGTSPLSSMGYNIKDVQTRQYDNYAAELTNVYYGKGGLNRVYLGNAFFYKGLSIGININYIFGPLVKSIGTNFSDTASNYISAVSDKLHTKVKGFNYRLGIQYSLDSLISNRSRIVVGAFYENKRNLNSEITRFTDERTIYGTNNVNLNDTLINDTVSAGYIGLPTSFGFGITYENNYLLFGFDFERQLWKNTKSFDNVNTNLTNNTKYSFGMEYTPNRASKSFLKNINYRIGASYSNTLLNINDKQIKDMSLSFGFGIPFRKSSTKFNIGFKIGKRGMTTNGLIQENYYIMNLNFNMADIWFVKRKFN